MQFTVFSAGGYYLYNTLRSIFAVWILFILYTRPYFMSVDTIYTIKVRSIFTGWILPILYTTQYFRSVDTIYNIHYAVFLGGGYY